MKAAFGRHVEVAKCALSVASYKGHPDLVYILLEAGADDLNFALSAASKGGQVTVVELLLEYGAEINSSTFPLPSPLECAISNSHLDVATLLIEAGGNINGAISNGNTYLMMAAGKGDQRMVELLLVYVYTQVDAQIVGLKPHWRGEAYEAFIRKNKDNNNNKKKKKKKKKKSKKTDRRVR
ncbi:fibronectin type 3 and ankyrin repeat domains protein 1-like [Drosophila albomicans]|uniref:Fibronectin type 3 and ankyrin repeat domains protein 1-like n=1 Tax=Drosophila albomicans TaxID=7291 RepID=A0A9C6WLZ6_DROAB|nr:fibronectin type 3 and ankyrin repeat domains protein 1-like [Drosophila albomicans]